MLSDGMFELYAWKIPLTCIHKNYEKHAILTFADCYLSEKEMPEEYRTQSLDYIKSRRKRLYALALEYVSVLQVMIAEKFILWTELLELLEQAIRLGNPEINAELLEYQNRCFGHIDREQEQEKEFKRELKLQTKILETGILPVGVIKKSWSYRKKRMVLFLSAVTRELKHKSLFLQKLAKLPLQRLENMRSAMFHLMLHQQRRKSAKSLNLL